MKSSDEQRPASKEYVGYIWAGDQPGIRLSVWACSSHEACAAVIAEYGDDHPMSLWNEADASEPR